MIKKKLKEFIRQFYLFARTSDDIADNEKLGPKEKVKILSYFDKCLKEKKNRYFCFKQTYNNLCLP